MADALFRIDVDGQGNVVDVTCYKGKCEVKEKGGISRETPLKALNVVGESSIEILTTHSSPDCWYILQGGRYWKVCN